MVDKRYSSHEGVTLSSAGTDVNDNAGIAVALSTNATATERDTVAVSVVIPCLNEEGSIATVLENLISQYDWSKYEIIVVDGRSVDGTRKRVEDFIRRHPASPVRLLDNPSGSIPAALNRGIAAAKGEIVVRMDGHSYPSEGYIRSCLQLLHEQQASIVGMPWRILPGADTIVARAIALAVSHPVGAGDAKYRWHASQKAVVVDTVPFGVFRKNVWQQVKGFNEILHANEDYDFNYRVRLAGGRILLGGNGYCSYFARSSFRELSRQYYRYGSWKFRMLLFHPRSVRLRQVAAPALVASILCLPALGMRYPLAWWMLGFIFFLYMAAILASAAWLCSKERSLRLLLPITFAFAVVHFSWGAGFLRRALRLRKA